MATTLATTLLTTSSEAAEIIAVRIGRHPEFTRVVFELDRAAGYRIERSDPASDVAELVISLDARSIPRRVRSSKSLVKYVEVEPFGARSIARIRLASNGLRLKEMILANPPRIVLDVISDRKASPVVTRAAKTATTQTKKIEPVPAPKEEAVPSLDEPTFDEIVAQLPAETEPVPVVVAEPVEPVPPEPVVEIPVEMTPKPDPAVPELDAPSLPETIVDDEPSTSTPIEEPGSDESEMLADEDTSTGTPRPMVAKSEPSTWQRQDWMTWAFAGLGSVVLLFGGILATRRLRGGEEEVDFSGADSDFGTPDSMQAGNDVNPFSAGSADATIVSSSDDEKQSESVVFGGSEEKSMEDMEVISRNQVNESLGGMPAAAGGIPEEFQQMMREMNQRVEALEGRIDELVDARDRLERQVAAQTEELRVQRAAIARTQRAVRNLARPEGGEGEQEATEPALRDPK